jgi:hypothetical protein
LTEKSSGFEKLRALGYTGYIDFKIYSTPADPSYIDSLFIDEAFAGLMGRLGLSLSGWYLPWKEPERVLSDEEGLHQLIIPGPKYYSQKDEAQFFNWLGDIRGIQKVRGSLTDLVLYMNEPVLDEGALRDLIALMNRYNIDMSCLQSQCAEENQHWLKDWKKYWYKPVFGKKDKKPKA